MRENRLPSSVKVGHSFPGVRIAKIIFNDHYLDADWVFLINRMKRLENLPKRSIESVQAPQCLELAVIRNRHERGLEKESLST